MEWRRRVAGRTRLRTISRVVIVLWDTMAGGSMTEHVQTDQQTYGLRTDVVLTDIFIV